MKKQLFFFIGLFLSLNLLQAFFTPLEEDEAYYWLWSQNLDWGYFDHPPMIAWWGNIGYNWFQNELGFRLVTVFLNSLSLLLLWQILHPKNRKENTLFGLLFFSTLIFQVYGFLSTPDSPLLFFTILYLFSLKSLLKRHDFGYALLLGISLAGLMYSKYHGILVIVFTLIPILSSVWKKSYFYFSVVLSLVLYSPHIIWLVEHDFAPIRYHFLERSADEHFEFRKLSNYLLMLFFGTAPLLTFFLIKAIWKFKTKDAFQKAIYFLAVLPGIFFFFSIFKDNVQPQWLLISFISTFLLGFEFYREKELSKPFLYLGCVGVVLLLVLRIGLTLPSISPLYKNPEFAHKVGAFDLEKAVFEKYQEASVYLFYNPTQKATTHRTIGNRKSQFSLWDWEEQYAGRKIDYVSPWIKSDRSFVGYKNYDYHIKTIAHYETYHHLTIEAPTAFTATKGQSLDLILELTNGHERELIIGPEAELKLNATYYQEKQYKTLYSTLIQIEELILAPHETKKIKVSFPNIDEVGEFKVCIGIYYDQIGTTYLSSPMVLRSL